MRTVGSMRAAAACTAMLRAISPPSAVTAALLLIFWALNGATRIPRRAAIRHSAVTNVLLPTDEAVPRIIGTGAGIWFSGKVGRIKSIRLYALAPLTLGKGGTYC